MYRDYSSSNANNSSADTATTARESCVAEPGTTTRDTTAPPRGTTAAVNTVNCTPVLNEHRARNLDPVKTTSEARRSGDVVDHERSTVCRSPVRRARGGVNTGISLNQVKEESERRKHANVGTAKDEPPPELKDTDRHGIDSDDDDFDYEDCTIQ